MSKLQQLKEEAREKLVIEIVKILAWQQAITSQGESYNGEKDWALNRILSLMDKAKEEGKAIGREEATQRTKIELDKYVEDMEKGLQGAYGSYSRQILNIVVSSAKEARTRTLESINPSK